MSHRDKVWIPFKVIVIMTDNFPFEVYVINCLESTHSFRCKGRWVDTWVADIYRQLFFRDNWCKDAKWNLFGRLVVWEDKLIISSIQHPTNTSTKSLISWCYFFWKYCVKMKVILSLVSLLICVFMFSAFLHFFLMVLWPLPKLYYQGVC